MDIYLVGGAVRDRLLGIEPRERDWVVVGATPAEMVARGFRPVGREFPVFLHPQSGEEYALARTERKTAPGYHGFAFHAAPEVTLEEDLRRRDLTVNAMAMSEAGEVVDPWGGRADLAARRLRHVSPAFIEDPVRILRAARFAARFAALGFALEAATVDLMRRMTAAGEVDALVPERVWQETARALKAPAPARFFETLRGCGALARIFPELERLFGVPQPPHHHPEVDVGVHTLMVLEQAARLSDDPVVRFAALLHDLGKGSTPRALWPRHIGHEERGVALTEQLCARLRAPAEWRDLARLTARWHTHAHRVAEMRAPTILRMLERLDALRRPARFEQFLLACEADSRGRAGFEERPYPQRALCRAALRAAAGVDAAETARAGLSGRAIGEALRRRRVAAIERLRKAA